MVVQNEVAKWRGLVTRHTPAEDQVMYRAIVHFETPEEAQRAVREKSGQYILNFPADIRVLP